ELLLALPVLRVGGAFIEEPGSEAEIDGAAVVLIPLHQVPRWLVDFLVAGLEGTVVEWWYWLLGRGSLWRVRRVVRHGRLLRVSTERHTKGRKHYTCCVDPNHRCSTIREPLCSIRVEHLLRLLWRVRFEKCEGEQDARLLRVELVGRD